MRLMTLKYQSVQAGGVSEYSEHSLYMPKFYLRKPILRKKEAVPRRSILHRSHGFRSADRNDIRYPDYIHLVSIIVGLELSPMAS